MALPKGLNDDEINQELLGCELSSPLHSDVRGNHVPVSDHTYCQKKITFEEFPEEPVQFVVRDVWGARPPKYERPLDRKAKYIFITYNTGVDYCRYPQECVEAVQTLQNRAMDDNGLPDIRYNFLIGGDGYVYEGRGWGQKPPRSKMFPTKGRRINIGYIGERKFWDNQYPIMELGLFVIYYGVENKLIRRDYEVTEYKKDGRVMRPVPNYQKATNLPYSNPWAPEGFVNDF